MRTKLLIPFLATAAIVATAFAAIACEAAGNDSGVLQENLAAFDAGAGDGFSKSEVVVQTVVVEREVERQVMADIRAAATPAPEAASGPDGQTIATTGDEQFADDPNPQATNRVIVRNADLEIQSSNADRAIREIGDIAATLGGWTVESEQSSGGFSSRITVRVPSERFENAIEAIQQVADRLVSSSIDSTDFTQEFTDLNARIKVLEETIESLTNLLEFHRVNDSVEDILEVQREIANQQTLLEIARGRVRFISESANFSKIEVTVSHLPSPMRISIDEEIAVSQSRPEAFSVTFWPPEDHDQFRITWDFGTGSGPIVTDRAIRSPDDRNTFTSATVNFSFSGNESERYVGRVIVEARSDSSVARGVQDFGIAVYELPTLNPLAELLNPLPITVNEEAEFRATISEHRDVRNLTYEWTFGDGTDPVTGELAPDQNTINATHTYTRYVPWTLQARLRLTGESDAGAVDERSVVEVYMQEDLTIQPSVFAPASTATNAVNVLIVAAGWAGNVIVFLAVTSPFWIIAAGIIWGIVWLGKRGRNRPADPNSTNQPTDNDPAPSADSEQTQADQPDAEDSESSDDRRP